MLADFDYPYEVKRFEFTSQGQPLSMAYMDVPPVNAGNGGTVVLLHGKNFCGATWESVIKPLTLAGYRVVVPDQVGFCKSTKPRAYQYGFHQLAANTHALLEQAGVRRPIVMGHSMGGMLAMRYALMYPDRTSGLVLVNPIGLEDWKAEGVPVVTVDQLYQSELKTDFGSIKEYQRTTYYAGDWRPGYDRWVEMLAGMYQGDGRDLVAWNQALTSDMVFMQPVVHELQNIRVPTLLMIGERDTTAIGKNRAEPDVAARLGRYADLGRRAAERIRDARLVTFPDLGHSPQVQAPEEFNAALLENLEQVSALE
ncbi:alpha/beta fold hydrolase [Skermanella pratensis]|uniref:alpha/beta fold hydrolase n=1 Tax=Skermanella pratensis TaxID=2233999 RepID=UPI001300FB06|nr:alpha/beta hydrolase [Skermanella pratensis]